MMLFKFVLIFVIMTIQNSNSESEPEIPGDCKDIECIAKLLREQKEISGTLVQPSGEIKLLLNT